MYGLSAGHGIKHFGQGALLVMIPSIRATLGLGDVAIGGMSSAQSISSGIANIPAGILTDMFRKKIAWILLASMLMVGTGYIIIGVSPVRSRRTFSASTEIPKRRAMFSGHVGPCRNAPSRRSLSWKLSPSLVSTAAGPT